MSGDGEPRRGSRLSSWGEVVRKDECRVLAECYDGGRQREEAFLAIPHHSLQTKMVTLQTFLRLQEILDT